MLSLNKALGKSEAADLLNENRADNWREYSRKQQRRGRIKLAFTAIGAATVGGLAGYGVGVSR